MAKAEKKIIIGCIADDFTGASDIGSFFVKGGLHTLLINGIPSADFDPGDTVQAIVIALKTRSIKKSLAVEQSLKALSYLKNLGCRQVYFKYCSTFDCTPEGNIGPVADALMEGTSSPYTILCPSLPVNGRKVRNGGLYVNDVPLHESSMKDHPVNPMWDYKLSNLMKPQTSCSFLELSADELKLSKKEINTILEKYAKSVDNKPFYVIPDYFEDSQGKDIARLFVDLPLITGGSGLAEWLALQHKSQISSHSDNSSGLHSGTSGRSIIFAGSCSTATQEQVRVYREGGGVAIELDAGKFKNDSQCISDLIKEISNPEISEILVHTSGNGDKIDRNDSSGLSQKEISVFYETVMADLAEKALEIGITRIIIAGGETSGAVTERLGFQSFFLGESVAPGVPVLIPVQERYVRLVLKSGNFGQPDFFDLALSKTRKKLPN